MPDDNEILDRLREVIEKKIGWGESSRWTNQDFLNLSEEIRLKTSGSLSHVTLKRIWGKVQYNSLPNTYTLNTLSQFAGYASWRDFSSKHYGNEGTSTPKSNGGHKGIPTIGRRRIWRAGIPLLVVLLSLAALIIISFDQDVGKPSDYSFSSTKTETSGLPNTVIFNFDASKAPGDSVVIRQSWDRRLDATVSKKEHVHTCIYYLPDYYRAKLLVNDKVVKQHDLFIKSEGWLTAVLLSPRPVYIDQQRVMRDGKMFLPVDEIVAQNIPMLPEAPRVLYTNVQDFGPIFTDNFVFETELKNEYRGGASVCQETNIYLLCEGTAIRIPLSGKRCVSNLGILFTNFSASGKKNNLSTFGVDFASFIKVKIVSKNGLAKIFLNDQLAYTIDKDIVKSKIIGINYYFDGTGSVEYVRLYNEKMVFEDDFD